MSTSACERFVSLAFAFTPTALFSCSAGQYKRIVSWPGTIDNTSGVVEIDSPFAAALDETSRVEIMPFRGKNIFHNTHCKIVILSRFVSLSVSLTQKASLFQTKTL